MDEFNDGIDWSAIGSDKDLFGPADGEQEIDWCAIDVDALIQSEKDQALAASAASAASASASASKDESFSSSSSSSSTNTNKPPQLPLPPPQSQTNQQQKESTQPPLPPHKQSSPIKKLTPPPPPLPPEDRITRITVPTSLKAQTSLLIKNASLSSPLKNTWTIMPHQKIAIIRTLRARRLILAYDMGLGKTVICCVAFKAFNATIPACRAIILSPVSLCDEWVRTAVECVGGCGNFEIFTYGKIPDPGSIVKGEATVDARFSNVGGGLKGLKVKKSKDDKVKKEKKGVVFNAKWSDDDSDEEDFKMKNSKGKRKKRDVVNDDIDDDDDDVDNNTVTNTITTNYDPGYSSTSTSAPFVLICDEAHTIQSMTSQKTKATLKLALHKNCISVIMVTGTPMNNGKPCNIFPLLKGIRHDLGRNQREFEVKFCGGKNVNFGRGSVWDNKGSTNLEELHERIGEFMLRKRKEDVDLSITCSCSSSSGSGGMEPMKRIFQTVPVSAKYEVDYQRAVTELGKIYKQNREATGPKAGNHMILKALTSVRRVCADSKVKAASMLADEIIKDEGCIILFTYFVEVAKWIKLELEGYGHICGLLTGEVLGKERQGIVEGFQNGVMSCLIGTFGAAGVGITLTKACTVLLVERPWRPGDVYQSEDRIRRIGQTRAVRSIWLQSFEYDKAVDALLTAKDNSSSMVVDGKGGALGALGGGGEKVAASLKIDEIVFAMEQRRRKDILAEGQLKKEKEEREEAKKTKTSGGSGEGNEVDPVAERTSDAGYRKSQEKDYGYGGF